MSEPIIATKRLFQLLNAPSNGCIVRHLPTKSLFSRGLLHEKQQDLRRKFVGATRTWAWDNSAPYSKYYDKLKKPNGFFWRPGKIAPKPTVYRTFPRNSTPLNRLRWRIGTGPDPPNSDDLPGYFRTRQTMAGWRHWELHRQVPRWMSFHGVVQSTTGSKSGYRELEGALQSCSTTLQSREHDANRVQTEMQFNYDKRGCSPGLNGAKKSGRSSGQA